MPLLLAPRQAARLLGLPDPGGGFYPRVLGGVLTGVATALAIQRRWQGTGPVGLGTAGAIAINALGGTAVVVWLMSPDARSMPRRGRAVLSAVAASVLGIGAVEAVGACRRQPDGSSYCRGGSLARSRALTADPTGR